MTEKKVVFITGPMRGVPNYWLAFEKAEDDLSAEGFIPLSPSRLPHDLSDEKARELYTAMMKTADAVLFLPGWDKSVVGQVEMGYCKYIRKPAASSIEKLKEALA